jgi:MurNAc alpha-1-phosphate uridylyltransferase
MKYTIDKAFILAAGMGTRLKPYTDHCPKPMVELNGRPIIDHVLDRLVEAGVAYATVNLHYRAEQLEAHLAKRTDIEIKTVFEPTLLDTGGGIKNALPAEGDEPFYVVSGDSVWTDSGKPALQRMAHAWTPETTELLLLLQPLERMALTSGKGDYNLVNGRPVRSPEKDGAYMWTSVRICSARLFDDTPDGPFSFLTLMDRAEKRQRLGSLIHKGEWYHITTPDDLDRVNASFKK